MKPKPAKPLIRYAVVDEHGETKTSLHRVRKHMDYLVKYWGDPGERVAVFECREINPPRK